MTKPNFKRLGESLKLRCKNIYFWVGLAGTFLLAAGIDPSTLTTWPKLFHAIIEVFENPYLLVYCAMAIIGDFVDTSTPGLRDVRLESFNEEDDEEYKDI